VAELIGDNFGIDTRLSGEGGMSATVLTENPVNSSFGIGESKRTPRDPVQYPTLAKILGSLASIRFVVSETETGIPTVLEISDRKKLCDARLAMVQSADFRKGCDSADRFYRSQVGRVPIQRQMKTRAMVIGEVRT